MRLILDTTLRKAQEPLASREIALAVLDPRDST
jgi:hypothetical protein